jgi:uncharacterized protein YndB with AHSA1/START domain
MTTKAADRELIIRRKFDAPRERVFDAWIDPELGKQWSAPRDFTVPFLEGDPRPGGTWRLCMRRANGEDLWVGGVYREVQRPERLVSTHAWENPDGTPGEETLMTITLAERDGKTEMTFRQSGFETVESRDGHREGWTECFDQLDELLTREPAR